MLQRQLFPDEFNNVPEEAIKEAARYGTEVHESIELFDSSWINDGTQEVLDYIGLCQENDLVHERSEYTVTDGENWASNIDKVYRSSDDTFSLGDIKTYGTMTSEKLEKARWQLSIYAYFFELQNKGAKVGNLFILHIRNKAKQDGTFEHIRNIMPVERIPSDICKELLDTDLQGKQFINPYSIPEKYREQEDHQATNPDQGRCRGKTENPEVRNLGGYGKQGSENLGYRNNEVDKKTSDHKAIVQLNPIQGRPSRT